MTLTRALIATGFLAGFALGIWTGTTWLTLTGLLRVVVVLLSADWHDRSGGARGTDLPSFRRQER
jgi:hypothetical protein